MTLPAPAPPPPAPPGAEGADGGPRLYGVVDVMRPDRVAGWAIDRADAAAAVEIEVLRDGRRVALLRADRTRPDLVRGGVGTGRYGFSCPLEPPIEPGLEFTVEVRARTADGATTPLRRAGATPPDPDRRLLERLFEEVRALRAAPPPPASPHPASPIEPLLDLARRLELAQLRIEAALDGVAPPPPPRADGLRWLVAAALAVGLGSLGLGLWSMWG